jgi:hypothetical protein
MRSVHELGRANGAAAELVHQSPAVAAATWSGSKSSGAEFMVGGPTSEPMRRGSEGGQGRRARSGTKVANERRSGRAAHTRKGRQVTSESSCRIT